MSDEEITPAVPLWIRTQYSYSHTTASGSDRAAFPPPGMSVMTIVDDPTEDVASEAFFDEFVNWYASSYRCRSCPSHLYKTVFPEGHEFEISTDDPENPRVGIKRLFSCAQCKRFVTTAASEDDVARATEHAVRTGGAVAAGLLGDTNNFEYECLSLAEYRGLLETTDAAGTTVGRADAGFIRVGSGKTVGEGLSDSVAVENSREALFELGYKAFKEGRLDAARDWWTQAADLGSYTAMFNLGMLAGKEGDRAKARSWYRQAADLGFSEAMDDLGLMASEDGDRTSAISWWTRAADLGNPRSMHNLGAQAYMDGDEIAARRWWIRAADLGNPESIHNMRVAAEQDAAKAATQAASTAGRPPRATQGGAPEARPTEPRAHKNGCYVATAVYGSYDCQEVWVLRRWRDTRLAPSAPGRHVIRLYYRISPTVVTAFGNQRWFVYAGRRALDRFVARLRASGYSSLPYSDGESSS